MLIDWMTVAAQIVNFLILVFLLKHFLYGPIIRAMDKREEKVVNRLREAEQQRQEAEKQKQVLEERQRELERQREEHLSRARQEAEELHRELAAKARQEVRELRERWQESLQSERHAFLKQLRQRAGMQVCRVARKALTELADASLEQKMVASLLAHLRQLEEEKRRQLREAAGGREDGLVVQSVFELPQEERQKIAQTLQTVAGKAEVRFEVQPELICGIRIQAYGCVVGWNLEGYLEELEQDLAWLLEEEISGGRQQERPGFVTSDSDRSDLPDKSDRSDEQGKQP